MEEKTELQLKEEAPLSPGHTETITIEVLADPLEPADETSDNDDEDDDDDISDNEGMMSQLSLHSLMLTPPSTTSPTSTATTSANISSNSFANTSSPTFAKSSANILAKPSVYTSAKSSNKYANTSANIPSPLAVNTSPAVIRDIHGRKRHPENWKQAVRQRLRESGQEYVNASGKVIKSRQVRSGCAASCHHKCTTKFSMEQRQRIHDAFWRLTDAQKVYFYWKYTARTEPKRRRKRVVATKQSSSADEAAEQQPAVVTPASRRSHTIIYRFEVKGEMLTVCSVFFFGTLDITSRRVSYFYEHNYDPETSMPRTGQQPYAKDTPRKPTNVPDLGPRLDALRAHIRSFPSVRSSGSTNKRYLASDLSIARMYNMYKESTENPLKQHWYHKVFKKEFHLGFRSLQAEEHRQAKLATKRKQKSFDGVSPAKCLCAGIADVKAKQEQMPAAAVDSKQLIQAQPSEYPGQYNSYNWPNGYESYNTNNYQ